MQTYNFSKEELFEYSIRKKKLIGIIQISLVVLSIVLIGLYFLFLKNVDFILFNYVEAIVKFIFSEISKGTLLGAFYSTLFGGLFFVTIPNELLFMTIYLGKNNPFMLLSVYLIGLSISYMINYFVGLKFAKLVKHLIPPEKFYQAKGALNRYGKLGIFVFNVLPLPSQQLTAILGVFKYNKARFYTFFLLGQAVKYIFLIYAVGYFI